MGAGDSKQQRGWSGSLGPVPDGVLRLLCCWLPDESLLASRLVSRRWAALDAEKWTWLAAAIKSDTEYRAPRRAKGAMLLSAGWAGGGAAAGVIIAASLCAPPIVFLPFWIAVETNRPVRRAVLTPFLDAYRMHEQGLQLWEASERPADDLRLAAEVDFALLGGRQPGELAEAELLTLRRSVADAAEAATPRRGARLSRVAGRIDDAIALRRAAAAATPPSAAAAAIVAAAAALPL